MKSPEPYVEPWTAARRFLCLAMKARRTQVECSTLRRLHEELGGDGAARLAADHRAEPIVAHGLSEAGIGGAPWDGWHEASRGRIGRMMCLLDEIAARAGTLGIPVVALKNGAIARALHRCPACVPMGDLDLLVPRGDFVRMHEVLTAMGFAVVTGGARAAGVEAGLAEGGTDYGLSADGETYAIDLQWRAVSGRWLRADQEPSADELIGRSMAMPGTAARMLAPVDNLVQVALHTAKHSYCRAPGFRLHLDVDRVVHGTEIAWDAVMEMVRRLGVGTAVFLSLSIPRGLFGTPVPAEVLRELAPAPARQAMLYRWLRSVSVFEPERPKFTRATQLLFHMALADGSSSVWRTFFPPAAEMRSRHGVTGGRGALMMGYGRRLADVVLRYQH